MRSYPLSILTEEYYWMWPSVNVKHEPSIIVNALIIAPAIAHSCFGLAMGLVFTMTVANQRGVKISGRKGVILNGH